MKLSRDQITGAAVVLLGLYVFAAISGYSVPFTASYPGPRALPGLAAIGFVICGTGIFINGCRHHDGTPFLTKQGWGKLLLNVLLLALYILAMKYFGYSIATPILLFILSTWYAKGYTAKLPARIIFAIAVTIIVYLAYHIAFGYNLPVGEFFE